MAFRTQVRAFKCAGCDHLTVNKDDLNYRSKVTVLGEQGQTLMAHTDECLVEAVANAVGLSITGSVPLEGRSRAEAGHPEDGQPTASVAL